MKDNLSKAQNNNRVNKILKDILPEEEPFIEPKIPIVNFVDYNGYIIENYSRFYTILLQNGYRVEKNFCCSKSAEKWINKYGSKIEYNKNKRKNKTFNIRLIK